MKESSCKIEIRLSGKPYPRTCPVCKFGPCVKKLDEKGMHLEITRLRDALLAIYKGTDQYGYPITDISNFIKITLEEK